MIDTVQSKTIIPHSSSRYRNPHSNGLQLPWVTRHPPLRTPAWDNITSVPPQSLDFFMHSSLSRSVPHVTQKSSLSFRCFFYYQTHARKSANAHPLSISTLCYLSPFAFERCRPLVFSTNQSLPSSPPVSSSFSLPFLSGSSGALWRDWIICSPSFLAVELERGWIANGSFFPPPPSNCFFFSFGRYRVS